MKLGVNFILGYEFRSHCYKEIETHILSIKMNYNIFVSAAIGTISHTLETGEREREKMETCDYLIILSF